jgi:hypothetical protein
MKPRLRSLMVPVVCLVALSACGSATDSGSPSSTAPDTTATSSSPGSPAVSSVAFSRSGGLKPVAVSRVFSADQPPPKGYTPADVRRALAAATAFVDSGATIRRVSPVGSCCDRYAYRVTITMADGTSKSFSTVDGVAQPKAFDSLIRALA